MEYVIGPVLALLLAMKFTDYKTSQKPKISHEELLEKIEAIRPYVDAKIVEQNAVISNQTLKLVQPMAKSVTAINEQLGL